MPEGTALVQRWLYTDSGKRRGRQAAYQHAGLIAASMIVGQHSQQTGKWSTAETAA